MLGKHGPSRYEDPIISIVVAAVPKIVYMDPESGQEVAVDLNERMPEITIGRNPGNVIRVNNPSISRQHAKVVYDNGQCTLIDLDSSNGSYINGNRIRSQVLVDGDRIRVGEFPVDFVGDQDGETAEVDKSVIDSMLNGPGSNGDFRRQTALGGFGAEPDVAEQSGPIGHDWRSPAQQPSYQNDAAFDFVNNAPPFRAPEPVLLDDDAFLPEEDSAASQEFDAGEFIVDEEDLLEEIPVEDPSADLEGISLEADHTMEEHGFELSAFGRAPVQEIDAGDVEPLDLELEPVVEPEPEPLELEPEAVEHDQGAAAPELSAADAAELEQLRARVLELENERDELAGALDNRAADPGSASQVQIDRLRNERDRLIEERRNLKRQISDLQSDLAAAPDLETFEGTTEQLGEAQTKITTLEGELGALREQLQERDDRISSSETETELLKAELEDYRSRAAHGEELGQQLSGVQETLSQSQEQFQEAIEQIASLERELETAKDEIQQLASDLDLREQRAAESDAEIGDLRGLLADSEDTLSQTAAKLEETLELVQQLESQVTGLQAELDARPKSDEVDELVSDLTSTRASLETVTAERDQLRAGKEQAERDLAEHRKGASDLEKRHAQLQKQLGEITRERDTLKTEKGAFARETDYLQVERRKLDAELRDLRKLAKKLEKDDKRKKQIFSELSGDLKKLVAENNSLQSANEELQKRLDSAPTPEGVKEIEGELATAKKTIKTLENETNVLTRELGSLGEERDALSKTIEELQEKVTQLEKTAGESEAARDSASEELEKLRKETETLRTQLAEAEKSAGDALNAAMASASSDDVTAELDALRSKLAETEKTLGDIILERDKLEDQLKKKK